MPKFKERTLADLEAFRAMLRYEPETGRFFRRDNGKPVILDGKARFCVNKVRDRAMRIAWALHMGEWPKGNVYSATGDLCFANLRLRDETRYVAEGSTRVNKRTIYTYGLWARYKIKRAEYEALAAKQNNCCAICLKPESHLTRSGRHSMLHVDHDHDTGQIRELLCSSCNSMLGFSKENESLLHAAAAYLRRHRRAKFSVISEGSE